MKTEDLASTGLDIDVISKRKKKDKIIRKFNEIIEITETLRPELGTPFLVRRKKDRKYLAFPLDRDKGDSVMDAMWVSGKSKAGKHEYSYEARESIVTIGPKSQCDVIDRWGEVVK